MHSEIIPSKVVLVREVLPGVVEVKLHDSVNKNTFSVDLVKAFSEAIKTAGENNDNKVIIITGYDSYFASGGTQESLLKLSEGQGQFSDTDFYSLAINCPIPVISAMQGHGIGGGLVLGLFSDFVVMSRESIYTANFMKYGFTPGMGASLILPYKFGLPLAQEMMLTARTYRGEDLQKRGISFPVVPRNQVMNNALAIAEDLVDKPRASLVALKQHLTQEIREQLPRFVRQEVAMHELTFKQPEVRERVNMLFGA